MKSGDITMHVQRTAEENEYEIKFTCPMPPSLGVLRAMVVRWARAEFGRERIWDVLKTPKLDQYRVWVENEYRGYENTSYTEKKFNYKIISTNGKKG